MNFINKIKILKIGFFYFIIILNLILFINFFTYSEEFKLLESINNLLFRYLNKDGDYFYFYISKINDGEIKIDKISYHKEAIKEINYTIVDLNKKLIKEYYSNTYIYDKEKGKFSDKIFNMSYKYDKDSNSLILKYDEYKKDNKIQKEEKVNLSKKYFLLFTLSGINGDMFFYFLNFNFNNYKNIKEKISFLFFNQFFDSTIQHNKDNKSYLFLEENKEKFYQNLKMNNIFFDTKDIYELTFNFEGFVKLYLKNMEFFVINFNKLFINNKNILVNNINIFGGYKIKNKEKDNIFIIDYINVLEENKFFDLIEQVKKIER